MQWLGYLPLLALLLMVLWFYTTYVTKSRFPMLKKKRICLLIAHPDDEAMFFAPTVLALTRPELGNHVKILCFCTGDSEKLGSTREIELVKSAMSLGLRAENDVFVLHNQDFVDGMNITWDKQKISNTLFTAFAPAMSDPMKRDAKPEANIDVMITFDNSGVSSHANHISLYHGAREFIATLMRNRGGWECPVDLYTLSSVSVLRKYTSFVDGIITLVLMAFSPRSTGAHPSPMYFLSGPGEVRQAQKAMTTGHQSQMVWFRWGWIILSRYMVVNDLRLEKPPRA